MFSLHYFLNILQKLYKERYEETKSNFSVVPDSNEIRSIRVVQPWLSKVQCIFSLEIINISLIVDWHKNGLVRLVVEKRA